MVHKVKVEFENAMFLVRGKGAKRFEPVYHAFKHASKDTKRVCRVRHTRAVDWSCSRKSVYGDRLSIVVFV